MSDWHHMDSDGLELLVVNRTKPRKFAGRIGSYSFTCFRCGQHVADGVAVGDVYRCGCGKHIEANYSTIEFRSIDVGRIRSALLAASRLPAPVTESVHLMFDLDEEP